MKKIDKTFVEILKSLEKNSTCIKHQVAALIVKDDRIISSGWNGVPSGQAHCEEVFKGQAKEEYRVPHRQWSLDNELHAEWNAICFAAKNGIATNGADMYISLPPCNICVNLIRASGIKRVFYKKKHKRSNEGIQKLKDAGIIIEQIKEKYE